MLSDIPVQATTSTDSEVSTMFIRATSMARLLLSVVGTIFAYFPVIAFAQEHPASIDPSGIVKQFSVHHDSLLRGILRLGSQTKIPLGLVISDRRLCDRDIEGNWEGKSIADLLNVLTEGSGYNWRVKGDVLLIAPNKISPATTQLLEMVLPTYAAPSGTSESQALYLWMDVRGILKPTEGTALHILSSSSEAEFPAISTENITVEDVLTRLSTRKEGGVWLVFPFGDRLITAADSPPFSVANYQDTARMQAISCAAPDSAKPKVQ